MLLSRAAWLLLYCVLASAWVRLVVRRATCGWPRLLLAAPVLAGNILAPLLFSRGDEVCTRVATAFSLAWLSNAKVLGFALGRGPLEMPLNALQFGVVQVLPVTPQDGGGKGMARVGSLGKLDASGGSAAQLLGRCLAKAVTLGVVVFLTTGVTLPRIALEAVYAVGLYAFLGFLMDGPATLATSLIGLRISPHFDEPYRSHSIASFWGRRWNLTASNALRVLVYDTICDGRLVAGAKAHPKPPSTARRTVGMLLAFVTSGLIHEGMFWYAEGRVTGQWLTFFSLQGPMMLVEHLVRGQLKQRHMQPPQWVSIPLTLTILMAVGHMYFFPPPMDSGLADRVVASIKENYQSAASALVPGR